MKKLKNKDLQRISIEEFKNSKKTPITLVLDNVRSALNVGAIFRTADAFLIEKIILCGITATPPNKEIRKAALGSSDAVNWEFQEDTTNAILKLKANNYHIIAVEQVQNSTKLNNLSFTNKHIALILGNEINGVSQDAIDLCNDVVEIPQFGTKHSLNISVASGIVVWEIWKKIIYKR
tara:strand:+ start:1641 stop:2174 length:534 start_codon:yes stop_codon:yes gene_type:complete